MMIIETEERHQKSPDKEFRTSQRVTLLADDSVSGCVLKSVDFPEVWKVVDSEKAVKVVELWEMIALSVIKRRLHPMPRGKTPPTKKGCLEYETKKEGSSLQIQFSFILRTSFFREESSGDLGGTLHCHYSQVHSVPEVVVLFRFSSMGLFKKYLYLIRIYNNMRYSQVLKIYGKHASFI